MGTKTTSTATPISKKKYNVPICIHKYDAPSIEGLEKGEFPATVLLEDGSLIKFGNESLKVMHTPGHTPGSICLLGERLVFTGDTLFAGGIGRTDFPGGSDQRHEAIFAKAGAFA